MDSHWRNDKKKKRNCLGEREPPAAQTKTSNLCSFHNFPYRLHAHGSFYRETESNIFTNIESINVRESAHRNCVIFVSKKKNENWLKSISPFRNSTEDHFLFFDDIETHVLDLYISSWCLCVHGKDSTSFTFVVTWYWKVYWVHCLYLSENRIKVDGQRLGSEVRSLQKKNYSQSVVWCISSRENWCLRMMFWES